MTAIGEKETMLIGAEKEDRGPLSAVLFSFSKLRAGNGALH